MVGSRFCALDEGDLNPTAWIGALREAGVTAPLIIEEFAADVTGAERLRRTASLLQAILQ